MKKNLLTPKAALALPVAALLVLVSVVALAPVALAHAEIKECTPPIGGAVTTAPDRLTCTASQGMDAKGSSLQVFNASGAQVDKGDSQVDLNDPDRTKISVSLDTSKMTDGVYTVKWTTVSADDGDDEDGEFKFTVAASASAAQPTSSAASPTAQATSQATTAGAQAQDPAAEYCTSKGGTVTTRYPAYNTNAPQDQWLRLAGMRQFCTFLAQPDSTGFQSQISIALDTLYTDMPTLAVLAYLEPVALPPFTGANPSTLYCSKLGGTDVWGGMDNAAGGGWVTAEADSATNFQVVGMCVFPDGSAIDSWGLTYKANGVVRGVDLQSVVRYQPATLPNVFNSPQSANPPAESTVDKTLTASDNGSKVTLKVGDTLRVALDSNPTTGYSWQATSSDTAVLTQAGDSTFELPTGATPRPGAGGVQVMNFQAVGKGSATLTLMYVRPWETSVTPTPNDVWKVEVTVE